METDKAKAIRILRACGWKDDGQTSTQRVLMRPRSSPADFGGRTRLHLPNSDRYVTVGPRKVCFYRHSGNAMHDVRVYPTGELAMELDGADGTDSATASKEA